LPAAMRRLWKVRSCGLWVMAVTVAM
jgi:hypothetical protein